MPERRPTAAFRKARAIGPGDPNPFTGIENAEVRGAMPGSPGDVRGLLALAPFLRSLGKPLDELLGMVLKTPAGSKLPQRLRLTNWDAPAGEVEFMTANPAARAPERFRATPAQLDELIERGGLDLEQASARGVARAQSKIAKEFEAAVTDPRNPTIGIPKETKTPMRETLDKIGKPTPRRRPIK